MTQLPGEPIGSDTPLVSVIIPVHNRRESLQLAIMSVIHQTFAEFECIVVEDGTNACGDLPCFGDARLRYLRFVVHRGVSAARNAGVRESKAPWIAFLDSDDEWFPGKLKRQLEWLKSHPEYRIAQSEELWIRNGRRVNPPATHTKRGGDIFAASCERCMITPSSVIMQRTLFEEFCGFNEALPACEDYDLWLRITARYPVGLVGEVLLRRYGGHADQLSSTVPVLDRFRVRSLLGLLEKNSLNEGQSRSARAQLAKKARILALGYKKRGNHEFYERYLSISERFGGA